MVTINNTKINKTEIKAAADDAGISQAQLRDLAKQLGMLATGMKTGEDSQALSAVARVVLDAANNLGQSTSTGQSGGGSSTSFEPSPASTSRPGM
jgi:hypothetical protein